MFRLSCLEVSLAIVFLKNVAQVNIGMGNVFLCLLGRTILFLCLGRITVAILERFRQAMLVDAPVAPADHFHPFLDRAVVNHAQEDTSRLWWEPPHARSAKLELFP